MPYVPLQLKPGVNTEETTLLLQAGYASASNMRFRDGLAEKAGGFAKYYPSTVSGTPREIHAWQSLSGTSYVGVGTTSKLYIVANSTLSDVTPQTLTTNSACNFTTTSGSATVTVVDSNIANPTTYDAVWIQTPVAVGGVILHGLYQIQSVVSSTSYTITASTTSNANVSNSGAVINFSSTLGSATVTVTLAAHNLTVGQYINLPVALTFAGITISGRYQIVTTPTANSFTIQVASAANATLSNQSPNSGNARFTYYITLVPPIITSNVVGFLMMGAFGQFGFGMLGQGTTTTAQMTGTAISATDWMADNFGQWLVACPTNAAIYYWDPAGTYQTASLISPNAPLFNAGIFLSKQARILVAYGASQLDGLGFYQDPLLIRWCSQEDTSQWTATATNYAGSFRVPNGSKVVGGLSTRQTDLIWTDLDCWAMTYVGGQGIGGMVSLVYNFNPLGTSCGLVAQHACVSFASQVYWMGLNNFFSTNGASVQVLPCSVWDAVFQDLDTTNTAKIWCTGNTPFNEVIWYYPSKSGNTGQCDKYVKYNVLLNVWDYGPAATDTQVPRSAGIDQSVVGAPVWATPTGQLYSQETGRDADGSALSWSMTTGYIALTEGQQFPFVDEIIPDFKYGLYNGSTSATVQMTLYGIDQPSDTPRVYGPYSITTSTPRVTTRFRNRFLAIKIAGNDTGSFVRLGNVRARMAPDGRR